MVRFTRLFLPPCLLLATLACDQDPGVPSELLRGGGEYVREVAPACKATGFNAEVMNAVGTFGTASYKWKGYGVTRTITYKGKTLAYPYKISGDPTDYCYCVGATFQVYMTAFENWDKKNGKTGDLKGLSASQAETVRKIWYIVKTEYEKGVQQALTQYGLGKAIPKWSDAQPGDFVQFWRNSKSGHSAVFSSWKYTGSKITGITYFSCQGSGAGYASETIGSGAKQIDASRLYIGRAFYPGAVKPDAGPKKDSAPPKKDTAPPKKDSAPPKKDTTPPKKDTAPPKKDTAPPRKDTAPPQLDGSLPSMLDGPGPGGHADALEGGCALGGGSGGVLLVIVMLWIRRRIGA